MKHVRVGNSMCGFQNNAMDRNMSKHPEEPERVGRMCPIRTDQLGTNQALLPQIITSICPCGKNAKIYEG